MFREVFKTFREVWSDGTGRGLIIGAMAIVGTGTIFYWLVEKWSLLDSLYFTVVTLVTVGYGDLHPTTDLSKIFTMVFVVSGVGFILGFLNFIVGRTVKRKVGDRGGELPPGPHSL